MFYNDISYFHKNILSYFVGVYYIILIGSSIHEQVYSKISELIEEKKVRLARKEGDGIEQRVISETIFLLGPSDVPISIISLSYLECDYFYKKMNWNSYS